MVCSGVVSSVEAQDTMQGAHATSAPPSAPAPAAPSAIVHEPPWLASLQTLERLDQRALQLRHEREETPISRSVTGMAAGYSLAALLVPTGAAILAITGADEDPFYSSSSGITYRNDYRSERRFAGILLGTGLISLGVAIVSTVFFRRARQKRMAIDHETNQLRTRRAILERELATTPRAVP